MVGCWLRNTSKKSNLLWWKRVVDAVVNPFGQLLFPSFLMHSFQFTRFYKVTLRKIHCFFNDLEAAVSNAASKFFLTFWNFLGGKSHLCFGKFEFRKGCAGQRRLLSVPKIITNHKLNRNVFNFISLEITKCRFPRLLSVFKAKWTIFLNPSFCFKVLKKPVKGCVDLFWFELTWLPKFQKIAREA